MIEMSSISAGTDCYESVKGFDGSAKGFDEVAKGFLESLIGCRTSDPLPDNAQFAELKPARF